MPLRRRVMTLVAVASAALFAAVGGHRIVELLARSGLFPGTYQAYDHSGIAPAVALAVCILALLVIAALADAPSDERADAGADWLVELARDLAGRPGWRLTLGVFAAQLAALYGIESAEQLAGCGRFLGGLDWLGGPAGASLAVHLATGLLATLALSWVTRAIVRAQRLVATFLTTLGRLLRTIAVTTLRSAGARPRPSLFLPPAGPPLARRAGKRAPPLSAAFTFGFAR